MTKQNKQRVFKPIDQLPENMVRINRYLKLVPPLDYHPKEPPLVQRLLWLKEQVEKWKVAEPDNELFHDLNEAGLRWEMVNGKRKQVRYTKQTQSMASRLLVHIAQAEQLLKTQPASSMLHEHIFIIACVASNINSVDREHYAIRHEVSRAENLSRGPKKRSKQAEERIARLRDYAIGFFRNNPDQTFNDLIPAITRQYPNDASLYTPKTLKKKLQGTKAEALNLLRE